MSGRVAILAWAISLLAAPAVAQQVVPNPVTLAWDQNPEPDVIGYRVVVDQTIHDVGGARTFTSTYPAGTHVAAVLAYNATLPSPLSTPIAFVIAGQAPDPCSPPLGAHAPAIFPTSPTLTTGKQGSRSFLNYQLGGPDRVVEVAIQIDGVDTTVGRATGPTDDLKDFSGRWFVMPAVGSHTLGVRVLTAFGCALVRNTSTPLTVKP